MNYSEKLKYDPHLEEFFIERTSGYGKDETFERKPLSEWGLLKRFELYVHVIRKIETSNFENPIQVINYKLPLTYEIENIETGKTVFLKLEKQAFDLPIRDNIRANWVSLLLRDVDSGVCQFVPLPNQYFKQDTFPYLKITVGKAIELTSKQEVLDLWKSGQCLGYYDAKMENFIV